MCSAPHRVNLLNNMPSSGFLIPFSLTSCFMLPNLRLRLCFRCCCLAAQSCPTHSTPWIFPPKAPQFVEIAKGWAWEGASPFEVQSRAQNLSSSSFIQLTYQANILPALNHPGTGARQLGAVPWPLSWLEVLKPANPLLSRSLKMQ